MRRRFLYIIIAIFSFTFFLSFNSEIISAREVVASKTITDIFGSPIGTIQIYDNAQITIGYKYGLRKADVLYCSKSDDCNNSSNYKVVSIMESSESNTYKNEGNELATYSYNLRFNENNEFRIRVEVYFGSNSRYTGLENIGSLYNITQIEILDTGNTYITGSSSGDYGNEQMSDLMGKITTIVNTVVLPIIYTAVTFFFVIKGVILGVQIVKSADAPDIRSEKVHALKWLVIGVAITYLASSIVGVITGYFQNLF